MGMGFHQFGHDGVLALDLGFELLDLPILGVLNGLGLAPILESEMAILEESLEPVVKLRGLDIQFIAEVGNRNLIDEMTLENGNLVRTLEMTTLSGHDEISV